MKKSLLALAVLSTASGFAAAASNVTVYGSIDAGVTASHFEHKDTTYSMSDGNWLANQIGIKGTEDLGGNNQVFFNLVQGFTLSNGEVNNGPAGGQFNRESAMGVKGDWGLVAFGRFGGLSSDTGSYSILGGSAYATSFATIGNLGSAFILAPRVNNAVAYASPEFGGAQIYAAYSNGEEEDENGNTNKWSKNEHYYGIGGVYTAGNFSANAIWEMYDNKTSDADASNVFTLGAQYDFGTFTLYGAYQYALNSNAIPTGGDASLADFYADATTKGIKKGVNQNAFSLSVSAPVAGGTASLQGQFAFGKFKDGSRLAADVEDDYNVWSVGTSYVYPLSKRTSVYAYAAYGDTGKAFNKVKDLDLSGWNATVGMSHRF